jgi:hypothetical protein
MGAIKTEAQTLSMPAAGRIPPSEFRVREDGRVVFHYIVEGNDYPGFDGQWHVVNEAEQRALLRMGGTIAEWLQTIQGKVFS